MRLGVLGGTFDPPHFAHLILAAEACAQLKLDRLLWVLTPYPPHKQGIQITPLEDRLMLLEAALADNPGFELSRVDIDRPPPHYAVDTIQRLRSRYPMAELFYLIGSDSLRDLPTWYKPKDLIASCDGLGVMPRPGYAADIVSLESKLPGIAEKVCIIDAPLLEISASQIRRKAALGEPFRYYLLPAVYEIILERQLYQSNQNNS